MTRGRRLVCPQCSKKGVTNRHGSEDWFVCRYCDWSACAEGNDSDDVEKRKQLVLANPDREAHCWVMA